MSRPNYGPMRSWVQAKWVWLVHGDAWMQIWALNTVTWQLPKAQESLVFKGSWGC